MGAAAGSTRRPGRLLEIIRFYSRKLFLAGILLSLILLFLYYYGNLVDNFGSYQSSSSSENKPPSPYHPHSSSNIEHIDALQEFWNPWSAIIQDSKPPIPEIKVQRPHSNLGVSAQDATKPRKPPTKLIPLSEPEKSNLTTAHTIFRDRLDAHTTVESDVSRLFHNRGVVIVAGGEYFGPAIVGIHMLRATGSKLPVEAFVQNWDEYEPALCEEYLPKLNARCLVIEDFLQDEANEEFEVTHYQLKSLALLFSSFEEVLLLDSDSIPLVDPADLFESTAYVDTGLVGWSDFWQSSETPDFWTIAGFSSFPPNLPFPSSESGQLLVDKHRHLKTLLLAAYYNIWGPKWFYKLLSQGALGEGDKNTFETAAIVLNATFYRVSKMVTAVNRHTGEEFKGSGMVQYMPEMTDARTAVDEGSEDIATSDRPAFIHANTPKMNAGHLVDEGDLVNSEGKHIRLWGSEESQKKLFGEDLEKKLWDIVKESGCELATTVKEWQHRKNICKRLKEHWNQVFR